MHRFHTKRVNNLQLQDHKSPFIRQNDENKIPSLTAKEAESPENTGFQPLFTHQKCSYILLLFSFLTGFLDA